MKSVYHWGSIVLAPIAIVMLIVAAWDIKTVNNLCTEYGYPLVECWGEILP